MILKKSLSFLASLAIVLSFVSCEEDVTSDNPLSNYIGLESSKYVGIPLDETVSVDAKIFATEVSNSDRVFELVVSDASTHDAMYYSVPATVTIPAGEKEGVFTVSITGTDLGSGKTLVVGLADQPGVNYATWSSGNASAGTLEVYTREITFNIKEVCFFNSVNLSITFDNYPEETAWELYDGSNNLVASEGISGTSITGFAALGYADGSTYSTDFCLEAGNYTFVIYDDYGDGMFTSASVQGSYALTLSDGTVLASGGGNFGTYEVSTFTLQ